MTIISVPVKPVDYHPDGREPTAAWYAKGMTRLAPESLHEMGGWFSINTSCASVMSQWHWYLQCQPLIERLSPDFKIVDVGIAEIAEHISQLSLAGIAGLNRRARRS